LGSGAIITPNGLPVPSSRISIDIPVMMAVTAATLPILISSYVICRWEGLFRFTYFGAYSLYLLLVSVQHDLLPAYFTTMMRYILLLTALMLIWVLAKHFGSILGWGLVRIWTNCELAYHGLKNIIGIRQPA
jgi:cation:H+ antiporter